MRCPMRRFTARTPTVNGQTETIDFRRKNVQTISLKKGETAVIDDVPDGADIIVTEAMSEKHEDEGYTLKNDPNGEQRKAEYHRLHVHQRALYRID